MLFLFAFSVSLSRTQFPSLNMVTMGLLPSPLMCTHTHPRYLHFLSFSFPVLHKFKSRPKLFTKSPNAPILTIRNCTPITAKPSSEIKRHSTGSQPDEKLRKLRDLFSIPGVNIDAYIIPSQDAHQVGFLGFSRSLGGFADVLQLDFQWLGWTRAYFTLFFISKKFIKTTYLGIANTRENT